MSLLRSHASTMFAMILGTMATGTISPSRAGEDSPSVILSYYCGDCHSGAGAEGGIRVDRLGAEIVDGQQAELVEKLLRVLDERQMPPADAEQPKAQERMRLRESLQARLSDFDCGSVSRPGRVTLRRLNRAEYDNTIRDLTGLDLGLADDFRRDDIGHGFDNLADVLTTPPILMEKYVLAAGKIADEVLLAPSTLRKIFDVRKANANDGELVVQSISADAKRFARRAYRRSLTDSEANRIERLVEAAFEENRQPPPIMRLALTAILSSPHFIYRVEEAAQDQYDDGVRRLNDFELATRLSYFLWSSTPDDV